VQNAADILRRRISDLLDPLVGMQRAVRLTVFRAKNSLSPATWQRGSAPRQ